MTDRRAAGARHLAALLGLTCLASGCIRGSLPPREFYRLAPPDSALAQPRPSAPRVIDGVVAIVPYETPGIYADGNIVYRLGSAEYGVYPNREWAIPLGEMLGVLTERVLRAAPLSRGGALFDPPSRRAHQYVWRGVVREFEEVNRGTLVLALATLDAQLVRTADDSVVWSGTSRVEIPVGETRSMRAVVGALSAAAARAINGLVGDAAEYLPRAAAAVAPDR